MIYTIEKYTICRPISPSSLLHNVKPGAFFSLYIHTSIYVCINLTICLFHSSDDPDAGFTPEDKETLLDLIRRRGSGAVIAFVNSRAASAVVVTVVSAVGLTSFVGRHDQAGQLAQDLRRIWNATLPSSLRSSPSTAGPIDLYLFFCFVLVAGVLMAMVGLRRRSTTGKLRRSTAADKRNEGASGPGIDTSTTSARHESTPSGLRERNAVGRTLLQAAKEGNSTEMEKQLDGGAHPDYYNEVRDCLCDIA